MLHKMHLNRIGCMFGEGLNCMPLVTSANRKGTLVRHVGT